MNHFSLRRRRRRGSVYVAILGLSILVAVIGLGGIALARAQARTRDLQADTAEARSYALSAVELARTLIAGDATWRTTHANGAWITNQPFGNGKISVSVTNHNGALNHADTDPVIVVGTGTRGLASQSIQVTLAPALTPYTCMYTSACAGGLMSLGNTTVSGAGSTIASALGISAASGSVYPDAESPVSVAGTTFYGKTTSLAAPRSMPASTVFDYYTANGTTIPYSAIPSGSGGVIFKNILLSPTSNPYGATDPNGIYIVNCANQNVTIDTCRIVGTLVLINPGSSSCIQNNNTWEPAVANLPCLLVQGNFTIKMANSTLNEAGATGNLNPASTPYPFVGGASDTNTTDKFPSAINGLVYVSGNLTTSTNPCIGSLIVGGAMTCSGTLSLSPNTIYQTNPPPGFRTLAISVLSGTWKQLVN